MNSKSKGKSQNDTESVVRECVEKAKLASRSLAKLSTDQKRAVLMDMATELRSAKGEIISENTHDVNSAKGAGLSSALVDRLTLSDKRIDEMALSVETVANLKDPVGEVLRQWTQPNGIEISKVRVPLGVIGIIYESRPNVTSDCGSLCIMSGNAVVLRGGSESFRSNAAIAKVLQGSLQQHNIPQSAVSTLPISDRSGVDALLKLDDLIDVIIPRGGESLIKKITENSRIPVIKHAKGLCHVYVDESANLNMAQAIAFNSKCQRPGVCNAMETLLVHEKIAKKFIPPMLAQFREAGVEVRGDSRTKSISEDVISASEDDWGTEYLDLVVSVRIVESINDAIGHIQRYGSGHSDVIVTDNSDASTQFLSEVDSAAVYVNASSRFTDGFQFGMGAEMGISTDRLHARGPMALEELTTYKYIIRGSGQIRE